MIKHFFTAPHPLNPLNLLNLEPLGGPLYTAAPAATSTLSHVVAVKPKNLKNLRLRKPSTLTPKACPKAATTTLGPEGPIKPKNPPATGRSNFRTLRPQAGQTSEPSGHRPVKLQNLFHNPLNPEPRSGSPYPSKE